MADGLRRLDGVADVEVDLQSGWCTLLPASDRTLPLAGVPEAVRGAGYRPGAMTLRARGRVEDDGAAFRIDGWPEALPLRGAAPVDGVLEAAVVFAPGATLQPRQ